MQPSADKQRSLLPLQGSTDFSLEFRNAPRLIEDNNLVINDAAATWNNGSLTAQNSSVNAQPVVYKASNGTTESGNESRNATIDVSDEYFPIGQVTITNKIAPEEEAAPRGINQLWATYELDLEITGIENTIDILPYEGELAFNFGTTANDDNVPSTADTVRFPSATFYEPLKVRNPKTGEIVEGGRSPFQFRYVGAVEGAPRSNIAQNEFLTLGDEVAIEEGQTKIFTLYGRIFTIEPNIISASDLEFYQGTSFLNDVNDRDLYLEYFRNVVNNPIDVDQNYQLRESEPLGLNGIIVGSLTPKNNIHVDDAAQILGYDYFNWYQEIISDNTDNQVKPAPELIPGLNPDNYTVTAPRVDPPPYQLGSSRADTLPYYWDSSADLDIVGRRVSRIDNLRDGRLIFYDDITRNINEDQFLEAERGVNLVTALAGIDGDNPNQINSLYSFNWSTNFNPAALNYTNLPVTEETVGGIQTLTSVQEVTNPSGLVQAPWVPSISNGGIEPAPIVLQVRPSFFDPISRGEKGFRLRGTNQRDTLKGRNKNDTVTGGGGNDKLIGKGGQDLLRGGGGNDQIIGGGEDDKLLGQGGNDNLRGGGGNDSLNGGSAKDILKGGGVTTF
ncbi:MAG: calcium-binding protein [Cyanobacteria bacterium P01_F01_bin.150]